MTSIARLTLIVMATAIAGCFDKEPDSSTSQVHRETLQSFHTTMSRVRSGSNEWYEVTIAVDGSKSFAMPVFFMHSGQFVQLADKDAAKHIDRWLKDRAEGVAAFGAFGQQFGDGKPFVAIEVEVTE